MGELPAELRRLSGTTLDSAGAANAWAGTTGLELIGALNAKAGTTGLELLGVLNQLAGTTGLGANAAAAAISGSLPAPVWQSQANNSVNSVRTLSLTITKPTGTVEGDLMLAAVQRDIDTAIVAPVGLVEIRNDSDAVNGHRITVFRKEAGAAEPADYTFQDGGVATSSWAGSIHRVTGHDSATPIDAHNGQTDVSTTNVTAPSVTTTAENTLLFFIGRHSGAATVWTMPASMTERSAIDLGQKRSQHVATQTLSTTGATGDRVATIDIARNTQGILVAVKP